jgi:hypothetical protein
VADTGWLYPSSGYIRSGGARTGVRWTEADWDHAYDKTGSDPDLSTSVVSSFSTQYDSSSKQYFVCGFGAAVPDGATIDGIEISVYISDTKTGDNIEVGPSEDCSLESTTGTEAKAAPASADWVDFGSASSLWSGSWTAAKVNDADFGVEIRKYNVANIASLYGVRVRITYTAAESTEDQGRIVSTIVGDKHDSSRLVHAIVGDKPASARIVSALVLQYCQSQRVVETLVGSKPAQSRLAHNLELIYSAVPEKFAPTADEAETVGTWTPSTGSYRYAVVDELDEAGDYLDPDDYVQINQADINPGTSQLIFSTTDDGANIEQPDHRRCVVRVNAADYTYTSYNVGLKGVLIYDSTTYVHATEKWTSLNYNTDLQWAWEYPPWGSPGDDWPAADEIKFGIRIITNQQVDPSAWLRIKQCYLHFIGGNDSASIVKTMYPTKDIGNNGFTPSLGGALIYGLWRGVANDDAEYVYDSTPSAGHNLRAVAIEGGRTRLIAGADTSWIVKVHVTCKLQSAGQIAIKGATQLSGQLAYATPQTLTDTDWVTKTFQFNEAPGSASTWDDPDLIYFGVYVDSVTSSAELRISRVWIEYIRFDDSGRIVQLIVGSKHNGGRLGHFLDFGTPDEEVDWWDSDYLKRREIGFGTNHSAIPADGTVQFELQTGYGVEIASNAVVNEGLGHSHRGICTAYDSGASPARWYTFVTWHGVTTTGHYNLWVRRYDHYTGTWGDAVDVGASGVTSDTHYVASICVDGEGYVWLFYGTHTSAVLYRKSSTAYSVASWGSEGNLGLSDGITYQRPEVDSSGNIWMFGRGATDPPPYGDVEEWMGYYKYTLSTHTWSSWNLVASYAVDEERDYPTEPGSIYFGGVTVDANDRIHVAIQWWEGYGTINRGRAMSHVWSDDGVNWYQFTAAYPSGQQVGVTNSAPIRVVAHDGYAACAFILASSSMANGPWTINNGHAMCVDSRGYPYFLTPWVYKESWNHHYGPCDLYISFWNGSAWTNTNLTAAVNGPQMMYYRTGCGIYADNAQASIYVYAFCEPEIFDDYFGGELYRWRGSGWATSWSSEWLTQNTAYGLGAINMLTRVRPGGDRELLLNRVNRIYWMADINYPYIKATGKDVRIVRQRWNNLLLEWEGTEIDRLPDRFRGADTELEFCPGRYVPENQNQSHSFTKYFVYYSFPNVLTDAANEPDGVWVYFEGFEDYTTGESIIGSGEWSQIGTLDDDYICDYYRADLWPPAKWEFVFGGEKSWFFDTPTASAAFVQRSIDLSDHVITAWVQALATGEYSPQSDRLVGLELYDTSSGKWFRCGSAWNVAAGEQRAAYLKSGDSVPTFSSIEWVTTGTYPEWYKIEVRITGSGVTYYFNDQLVVSNNNHMTSADRLRFGGKGGSGRVDHVTIKRYLATAPTIALGEEEGEANIPATYPRLMHIAELAYWRQSRAVHNLTLAKRGSGRIVEMILGEKPDQDRIAEWLELEDHEAARLVHRLETDKHDKSRLMQWLEAEKHSWSRIVHSLVLAYRGSARLAHDLELEASDLDTIAEMIVGDKHLCARIAQAIVGDKHLSDRLMMEAKLEAGKQSRIVQILRGDKALSSRLMQMIVGEVSLAGRIVHDLDLTKSGKVRLMEMIVGDKLMAARIAHTLEFEASPQARIANILLFEAHRNPRLAMCLIGAKTKRARIAHTLIGNKTDQERISQWAQVEAADQSRFAHDLELSQAASSRLVHYLKMDKHRRARMMEMLKAEKGESERIVHWLELMTGGATRVAQILVTDKHFSARLVHGLLFEASGSERIVHALGLSKCLSSRLAHSLVGDKHVRASIMEAIVAEASEHIRLVQTIVGDKRLSSRLSQWIEGDKHAASRLMHVIEFIGAAIGFRFDADSLNMIAMIEDTLTEVGLSVETVNRMNFEDDEVTPDGVQWSGEKMARITLTDDDIVPEI